MNQGTETLLEKTSTDNGDDFHALKRKKQYPDIEL